MIQFLDFYVYQLKTNEFTINKSQINKKLIISMNFYQFLYLLHLTKLKFLLVNKNLISIDILLIFKNLEIMIGIQKDLFFLK